jgi:hypothetical protein
MGLLSILVWVDHHSEIPDFNVPSWTDQFINILMQNVGKLMWHSVFKHSWPKTIRRDSFRGELHDFRLWRKIKKSSSVDFQGYFEQKILVFWLYIIRMVFLLFLFPDQLKDPSFGRKVYISNHFHRGQAAPTLYLITINTVFNYGSFTVQQFSVLNNNCTRNCIVLNFGKYGALFSFHPYAAFSSIFEIQAFDHTWLFILLRSETWRKRRKRFTHIVESSHPSLLLAIDDSNLQNCLTIQVTNMYVLTFLDFQFPACDNIFITFIGFSALSVSPYLLFIQHLNVRTQWAIIVHYVLLTSALYST